MVQSRLVERSRNFDLRLSGTISAVSVEVIDSPAGQTAAPAVLPCTVNPQELENLSEQMGGVDLHAIGRSLWRCAFGNRKVEELWRVSVARTGIEDTLLLRLTIDTAELAALPWELLYDETRYCYLSLDKRTPVTRFTRLPIHTVPWPQHRPLRLLFTGASPTDLPTLNVAKEWSGIEKEIAPLIRAGRLETSEPIPEAATLSSLLAALRRKVDIWHFAGHGQHNGLAFTDEQGMTHLAEAGMLGQILAGEGVRLAVLNACRAGAGGGQAASVAGALIRANIPAVIAMQTSISDHAALAFVHAFYDAIAVGQGVDQAVTAGRKSILAAGESEWWTPALFMRTPRGRIWREQNKAVVTRKRARELTYLNEVIDKYKYWAEKYTALAGIAEIWAAAIKVPSLDLPEPFVPVGFEKLEEHGFGVERRIERVPVDDLCKAVAEYKRLVILGEPGSGKTTTLWRLAYDLAVAAKENPKAPLPLLAPLGAYSGPGSALSYVQGYFGQLGPQFSSYLDEKRVVLLLDALNEMPQSGYMQRVKSIQELLEHRSSVQVVVTCREMDYHETLRLQKLFVKPLTPDRQREYLHRYLGQTEGDRLFQQMETTAGTARSQSEQEKPLPLLLALGRNPFMLVMTAQTYAARGSVLPKNRGRLLAAFVDTLLAREKKRFEPTRWPSEDVLHLGMARLAYAMQEAGKRGSAVQARWAAESLTQNGFDPNQIFYFGACANLLDISYSRVGFVHQLVQEYFAALALVERLQADDNLRYYWPDGWTRPSGWEETFVLLAGILPDTALLMQRLLLVNPGLAARCIAESGVESSTSDPTYEVRKRLIDVLTSRQIPLEDRDVAGIAVNQIGDSRPGVGLRSDGLPDISWVFVPDKDPISGRRVYIYGAGEQRIEHDFWMSRYPISYLQFRAFLDAPDGFQNPEWWIGLTASENHRRSAGEQRILYWNHPRESVSWYDAMAFCRWFTAGARAHLDLLPGELDRQCDWRIILPTEWQWEKAARGHDGRRYPWGQEYQEGYANINETWNRYEVGPHYLRKTTAVGMYPQGVSPYGVSDLSGNVWEWCINEYRNPSRTDPDGNADRVLRGGSLGGNYRSAAVSARYGYDPACRSYLFGIRVVVTSCYAVQ